MATSDCAHEDRDGVLQSNNSWEKLVQQLLEILVETLESLAKDFYRYFFAGTLAKYHQITGAKSAVRGAYVG